MKMKKVFQKGVTLVELLVSIVIALIVLSGAISVVATSRTSFVSEQEASFMQENARFAIEMLARDLRMAGSKGCAPSTATWSVNAISDATGLYGTGGIEGFEGGTGFPSSFSAYADAGSDAIIVRYADPTNSVSVASHALSGANTFSVFGETDISAGDKLAIVDSTCRHYAYFEATAVTSGSTTSSIQQSSGGNNCQTVLFANDNDYDCSTASTATTTPYSAGSEIFPYYVAGYFIGDSVVIPGVPALKRRVFTSTGQRTEELAQGVESMDILYGVDDSYDPDEAIEIDRYRPADEIVNWEAVGAVRFVFVLRSQSEFYDSDRAININDVDYDDRFLRQLVTSTVQIRARG